MVAQDPVIAGRSGDGGRRRDWRDREGRGRREGAVGLGPGDLERSRRDEVLLARFIMSSITAAL